MCCSKSVIRRVTQVGSNYRNEFFVKCLKMLSCALLQVILSVWSLFISTPPHGWNSFPELPSADKSGKYSSWHDNYLRPLINTSSSAPGLNLVNRAASRQHLETYSTLRNWTRGECEGRKSTDGFTHIVLFYLEIDLQLDNKVALISISIWLTK